MRQKLVIAPSVLSLDYARVSEQLADLNKTRAEWMHFDVVDGSLCAEFNLWSGYLKRL